MVTSTQIIALVFALVVVIIVSVFLKTTATGTAMRAIANDRDVSSLLGVPVRRVEALAWLGSGVICGCVFLMLPSFFNSIDQGTLTWFVDRRARWRNRRPVQVAADHLLRQSVHRRHAIPSYPVPRQPAVPARLPDHDAVRRRGRRDRVDQPQAYRRAVRKGDAMTAVAMPAETSSCPRSARSLHVSRRIRWFEPFAVTVVLIFGFFGIPGFFDSFWVANFTQMAVFSDRRRQRRAAVRPGRSGVARSGRVIRHRLLGDHSAVVLHVAAVSDLADHRRPRRRVHRGADRPARPRGSVACTSRSSPSCSLPAWRSCSGRSSSRMAAPGSRVSSASLSDIKPTRRPSFAGTDTGYYRFIVVAAFLMFMLASFVLSRKPGRAWASIRQSEAAALAAGIDVTRYKLWAFASGRVHGRCRRRSLRRNRAEGHEHRCLQPPVGHLPDRGGHHGRHLQPVGWSARRFFATCLLKFLTQNVIGHQFWTRFALSLFGFGLLFNLIQNTRAAEKKGVEA